MPNDFQINHVNPGEYPFPVAEGPEESKYLNWIRNHSNYMAVHGLLDYVRALGVLLRGIFINFLVLLPYLLVVSVIIAASHLFLPGKPQFTVIAVFGSLGLALLYALATPLYRIALYRTRLTTGSDSTVKLRDLSERCFGILLLIIFAVAAFEAISHFLDDFHQFKYDYQIGWAEFSSVTAIAVAASASVLKLLMMLGGVAKKLAMFAVGALGLLVPLLVVLIVAEYLVFNPLSETEFKRMV